MSDNDKMIDAFEAYFEADWRDPAVERHQEFWRSAWGAATSKPKRCGCDARGIGAPGVTCGDCPRDYKPAEQGQMCFAAQAAAAEREACASMIEGAAEIMNGRPSRRGPGDSGTWYESSATGFLVRSLVRAIRARGQA